MRGGGEKYGSSDSDSEKDWIGCIDGGKVKFAALGGCVRGEMVGWVDWDLGLSAWVWVCACGR